MDEKQEFTVTITDRKFIHVVFENNRGLIDIDTRGRHPTVTVLDYDLAENDAEFMAFDFSKPKELQDGD
jgi:hypothetical protein